MAAPMTTNSMRVQTCVHSPSLGMRSTSRARPARLLLRAAGDDGKGFGGAAKEAKAPKASKRGKSSSRPGQLSRKEQERLAEARIALERGEDRDGGLGAGPAGRAEEPTAAVVPQVVTDRMLKRILLFTGVPVFGGILLLPAFWYLKVIQQVDLPTWVVYTIQSLTFGGGLLGISYGILSTSWDPAREGSLSGTTEFKANLPMVMQRFRRRV